MKSYLPDDVLKKVDLATMAHSLEARVPILDYRIVEFSFRLPHKFKCDHGNKKRILKEVLYQYVPQKMMDRPKKGFSVPVFKWLHHDLNHLVEHYCSHQFISKQALFDQAVLDNLKMVFNKQPNNYFTNGLMWNFIVFQMWYEKNLM
jgi:asparagine synthase (glutamine-hydrolysing)